MNTAIAGTLMALVIAAGPPEPEFLDIDQPRAATYFSGESGERISQTFTTGPRTHLITAIAFQAWQPTEHKAVVKLQLRRYAVPAEWESGTLLGSQVGTFTDLADGDWVRFEFDKPVPVRPNTLYNVFFTNVQGQVGYRYANTDPYPGGLQSRWTPEWSRYFRNDLTFRVYSRTVSQPAARLPRIDVVGSAPLVGIVVPDQATAPEQRAAAQLQHFLSVMTGHTLPTCQETQRQTHPGRVIYLGRTRFGNRLIPTSGWGAETILVDTQAGQDIVISGGSDIGVLFATYRFLHDLGCRWLNALSVGENYDQIPHVSRLTLADRRLVSSPDFAVRGWAAPWAFSTITRGPAQTDLGQILDWGIRNGLNSMSKPGPVDQGPDRGHGYRQMMGHTLGGLVPGASGDPQHQALFKTHPEYFPLVNGKRVSAYKDGRAAQVCMSNPAVVAMAVKGVLEYLRKHPHTLRYNVGHNDEPSYWCECAQCLALDASDSTWRKNDVMDAYAPTQLRTSSPMSDRMVYFVNQIAERVEKEFPDIDISMYAYGSTVAPPRRWRPRQNVMIEYANASLCYQHTMSDPSCPHNKLWGDFLKGWARFGNRILIYDYEQGLTLHHHDTPTMWLTGLADYIRFTKKHGVYGWAGEGASHWVGSAIWFYLKSRLLWDVDADVDALITDFCDHNYGAAGSSMRKYHMLLNTALGQERKHGQRSLDILSPGQLTLADQLLQTALRQAARPATQHRVTEARVAFLKLRLDQLQQTAQTDPMAFQQYASLITETRELLHNSQQEIMISSQFHANLAMLYRPPFEALSGAVLEELPLIWKFRTDREETGEKQGWPRTPVLDAAWRDIRTDASWTEQPYPGNYHGTAWYGLDFTIPPGAGQLWLLFGAIDGDAWFWLNGKPAGKTTASPGVAWDKPFGLEITEPAKRGAVNRLIVKVKKEQFAAGIWKRVKLVREK